MLCAGESKGTKLAFQQLVLIRAAIVMTMVAMLVIVFAPAVLAANSNQNQDSIAVIIGNKDYPDAVNVDFAHNDAEAMKDFLIQKLGFRTGNVILLKNATGGKMAQWFGDENDPKGQLWDWVRKGRSNVFVFYSGHGAPDPRTKQSYLIPTDVNPERAGRGFSLAVLQRNLEVVKKKIGEKRHVILMMDACFSGVSGGGVIQKTSAGAYIPVMPKASHKITRLSASAAREVANWDQKARHGLLTSLFLKGVSGEADANDYGNGDGRVSWGEIAKYLKSEVSYQSRRNFGRDQSPQIGEGKDILWKLEPGPLKHRQKPVKLPPKPKVKKFDEEKAFQIAKSIGTCQAYEAFIAKYPEGFLAGAARAACTKIKNQRTAVVTPPISPPIQRQPTGRQFSVYRNYDLYGGDYARSKKGKWLTESNCHSICRERDRCVAYTYDSKNGVCFLKDKIAGALKPWNGAVSGILSSLRQPSAQRSGSLSQSGGSAPVSSGSTSGACGGGFVTYDRTDYQGNDIKGYRGSFSSCRRRCQNNTRCRGFSWIKKRARRQCWLKYAMRGASYKSYVISCVKR